MLRSAIYFLKHPGRTLTRLFFTKDRLRTFFSRAHLEELPDCQHPIIDEGKVLRLVVQGSVLDVGCGRGRWAVLLCNPHLREIVGVDVTSAYLREAEKTGLYNRLLKRDFEFDSLIGDFEPASFDNVLAVEVLEHLSKFAGKKLLSEMILLAKKRVVVTTPCGFYPFQGDCVAETHKCGWLRSELESFGFKVSVVKGRLYEYFLAVHDKGRGEA